jgi:hypothetical protein
MATDKTVYYRYLFIIGAIWNIVIALGFLFLTKQVLPLFGLQMPAEPVWLYLFSALVLVFGLGYYWVSRNLDRNHAVVGMGVVGKLLVFLILGYYWIAGSIPTLTALAGVGDLVFAILFLGFLTNYKSRSDKSV